MIYRLIYCCYPPFEAGVLLSYYGTTFGIFGSFVTFYLTDKKEKETRNAEIKPKITVDLEKEDEKVFKLTVYNCLQTPARNVFLYDEILDSKIEKYTTVYVTYNMPNDEFNKYKEKYKNISYIKQENKGVGAARNAGIKVAKGDYISFVDSDDLIMEDYCSHLLSIIGDADIAVAGREKYIDNVYDKSKTPSQVITVSGMEALKF